MRGNCLPEDLASHDPPNLELSTGQGQSWPWVAMRTPCGFVGIPFHSKFTLREAPDPGGRIYRLR